MFGVEPPINCGENFTEDHFVDLCVKLLSCRYKYFYNFKIIIRYKYFFL